MALPTPVILSPATSPDAIAIKNRLLQLIANFDNNQPNAAPINILKETDAGITNASPTAGPLGNHLVYLAGK